MSGKGDPFGSGGKTVIMPTPGGGQYSRPFEPLPLSPQKPRAAATFLQQPGLQSVAAAAAAGNARRRSE